MQRQAMRAASSKSSSRCSVNSHVGPRSVMCRAHNGYKRPRKQLQHPRHGKTVQADRRGRMEWGHSRLWPVQAAAADGAFDSPWEQQPEALQTSQGVSMPATVFNLVNVIMGAGYVSIPFACRQGGWAALAVLWLLGAVFCYTGKPRGTPWAEHQMQQGKYYSSYSFSDNTVAAGTGRALLQCCKLVNKERAAAAASGKGSNSSVAAAAGYEAVAERAFGPAGLAIVSGIMYAELLGICCVYVVLEAETLSTLLGTTSFGAALTQLLGPGGFGLLAAALLVPTVLLPDLNALSVLGALGVCAAATVGLALAGLFCSGGSEAVSGLAHTAFVKLQTLPQVLGILAFVYAGHSTFPIVQQSMAKPTWGLRAVTWGYIITAVICTTIGAFGYALYGHQTAAVITASLPALSAVALLCTGLTLCNPFSAFALTLEPVALAIQQKMLPTGTVPYSVRALIRLGLALTCSAVALSLPYVADLMAFVGALLTMSISLIIPALMHAALMRKQMPWWGGVLDGCVLVLGVGCAAVGASSAYQNLQLKLAAAAIAV